MSPLRLLYRTSSAACLFACCASPALSQTQNSSPAAPAGATPLPAIEVTAPRQVKPRPRPRARVEATSRPSIPTAPPPTEAEVASGKNARFDEARRVIAAPTGATSHAASREAIQALPQGTEASLDKVLLQFPGVSQDSAASGELHVRNEHGNLQYRINGIMLPDGVGAFGQFLDTAIAGNVTLLTGALPAQYGLRTAGVIDIQTRTDAFNNSGNVSLYGGSHGTITPSFDYGGTAGRTQYFVSGRYFGSDLGIENPTPAYNALHDHTDQGKGFGYLSTMIDDKSRLVFIGGTSTSAYQIPNNPGQATFGGLTPPFDSAFLNERQIENNQFGVVAYQRSIEGLDMQLSAFSRYSTLHFLPDVAGDLAFNGVASDVYRRSQTTGIASDNAWRWADAHTLRFGFQVSGEQSLVSNLSTVYPVDGSGDIRPGSSPFSFNDSSSKLGWLGSAYASDEWKLTNQVKLTAGLRFDQMVSYTEANQLSPRLSLTYEPVTGTVLHAGYARNFTPPQQVLAAPANLALVTSPPQPTANTQTPAVALADPVRPERSNVFDIGLTQKIFPGFDVGIDAYYKSARDLLDDGQFGAAYVLTAFNYDRGTNVGVEIKGNYVNGGFRAYANLAIAQQKATRIVSNQFLFGPDELAYIANNYVYTDHSQTISGSAGASYLWDGTRFSADLIYGSGLRSGFANTDHLPFYSQVNLGASHEFKWVANKPTTLRFDIVNVLDSIYQIRDGSGIGVFAPQYGARRGFFVGISQKL